MKGVIFFCMVQMLVTAVSGQTISVSNGASGSTWSVPVLSSTISKAGKNYEHSETSSASHTLLKVSAVVVWSVHVHQSVTSNWDPSLKLSVQRTGSGTGVAILSGGTSYIQLSGTSQPFFSGLLTLFSGNRDNIPIQYQISGLSVALPVKTYTTTVTYTISGL